VELEQQEVDLMVQAVAVQVLQEMEPTALQMVMLVVLAD